MDSTKHKNKREKRNNETPKKLSVANNGGDMSPEEASLFSTAAVSPDFIPESQDCFHIAWDWSEQVKKNRNPSQINIVKVESNSRKKLAGHFNSNKDVPECLRSRRLVQPSDSNIHDVSAFVAELSSLADGLIKSSDAPNTPQPSCSKNSSINLSNKEGINFKRTPKDSCQLLLTATPENKVRGREDLCELFNDSSDDLMVQCSQQMENQCSKTPTAQSIKTPLCGSKKKRLSLKRSGKAKSNVKLMPRKLDITEEVMTNCQLVSKPIKFSLADKTSKTSDLQEEQNNNAAHHISENIGFDDFDDEFLLNIDTLETKNNSKSVIESKFISTKVTNNANSDLNINLNNRGLKIESNQSRLIGVKEKKESYCNGVHIPRASQPSVRETTNKWQTSSGKIDNDNEADFVASSDFLNLLNSVEMKASQESRGERNASPIKVLDCPEHKPSSPKRATAYQKPQLNASSSSSSTRKIGPNRYSSYEVPGVTRLPNSGASTVRSQCTPEEIEKKRQEAIRKRKQRKLASRK